MNNSLLDYLEKEIDEEKISHAFLISTNNCEKVKEDLFSFLQENRIIPKQPIENNIAVNIIHPDNNLIEKNKILDLQKFIITKSIINKYKIYFILNAEYMNISSFNKLLKVLEEPSENVIGFLITEDDNSIIPTIKSRCKKFSIYYENDNQQNYKEIVNKLMNIKEQSYVNILDIKREILKNEKNEIIKILTECKEEILNRINQSDNIKALANSYKILDNIISLIQSNVNIELCLDKMFIEMRK